MSLFDEPVSDTFEPGKVVGGYPAGQGPECPQCRSRDTVAISRDAVWDETTCRCSQCGKVFIKG
jgi:DNA-directed RNA polymerase subunit RPC12/RpoP